MCGKCGEKCGSYREYPPINLDSYISIISLLIVRDIFMLPAECCGGAKCRSLGISTRGSSSSAQARKSWKDWPLVTSSVSRSNQKVTTRYLEIGGICWGPLKLRPLKLVEFICKNAIMAMAICTLYNQMLWNFGKGLSWGIVSEEFTQSALPFWMQRQTMTISIWDEQVGCLTKATGW